MLSWEAVFFYYLDYRSYRSWITPDPEEEWMMAGHVIKDDEGLVFVGPCSSRPAAFFLRASVQCARFSYLPMTIPAGAAIEAIAFLVPFTSLQSDRNRLQIGRVENPEGYEGNAHLPGKLVVRRVVVTLSNSWPYTDEMMLRADILFAGVLLAGNPDGTQAVSPEQFQGVTGVGEKNAAVAGVLLKNIASPPQLVLGELAAELKKWIAVGNS